MGLILMDVRLPNGKVLNGIPEGTSKDAIMQKAISAGWATEEDFGLSPKKEAMTQEQFDTEIGGDVPDVFGQVIEEEPVPEQERSLADKAIGAGETALALGTGAIGGAAGVLGGTLQGVISELRSGEFGSNAAARRIADKAEAAMSGLTYSPRSEAGQEYVGNIGEVGEALAPLAGLSAPLQQVGQLAKAARPQISQAGNAAKAAAETAADKTGQVVETAKAAKLPSTQAKIRELQKNEVDRDQVGIELDNDAVISEPSPIQKKLGADLPRIKKDKQAIEAVNQGFDAGFLDTVKKRASKADKRELKRMTAMSQRGKKDPLYEVDNRPADVAGDALLKSVNEVKRINRAAGQEINKVAKGLSNEYLDVRKIGDDFVRSLDEMDIKVNPDMSLDFSNSFMRTLPGSKSAISHVFDELAKNKNPSALDMHKIKRFIDEQVTYGKAVTGLGGEAPRALKKLRNDIDSTLDSKFPEYDKANKAYSDTIGALDEIQRLAGRNTDLSSNTASGALGVLSRRLMSNAQSRAQLNDAISNIEISKNRHGDIGGVKRIKGESEGAPNIKLLMLYADELDKVVGTPAKTSFTGGIETAIDAAENIRSQTAFGAGADLAKEGIKKYKGINQQGAYKAMFDFLNK